MEVTKKIYKIEESKLDKIAMKQLKSVSFIFIIPVLLALYFAVIFHSFGSLFLIVTLFGVILSISYPNKKKYLSLQSFELTEKYISQTYNDAESNFFIEYGRSRNQGFGARDEKTILFKEVSRVFIKPNGDIIITSEDNSILTNNGKIVVPAEIENYAEVKKIILEKTNYDPD